MLDLGMSSCQFVRGGAPWPSAISKILAAGAPARHNPYPRHLGCHMRPTPLSTPGNTPPTAALSIAVSVHPGTTASFLEDLSLCDVRHVLVRKPLVRLRECSHWPLLQPPHLQWLLHSLPSQAPPHELVGGFNPCEQILAKLEIFPKQGCK